MSYAANSIIERDERERRYPTMTSHNSQSERQRERDKVSKRVKYSSSKQKI